MAGAGFGLRRRTVPTPWSPAPPPTSWRGLRREVGLSIRREPAGASAGP